MISAWHLLWIIPLVAAISSFAMALAVAASRGDQPFSAEDPVFCYDRRKPQRPIQESLADRCCPTCGVGIDYDALNDHIKDAPKFCAECGQQFDWSGETDFKDWDELGI